MLVGKIAEFVRSAMMKDIGHAAEDRERVGKRVT
jgi:hypothetical protein